MMSSFPKSAIAIIGLAGRFPDAPDVQAFWRNLETGLESLVSFSDEEVLESGVPEDLLRHPNYVKKGTLLERPEFFDADFFDYNPREAEIIDPQQRVFLECAWEALESSGYAGEHRPEGIGVYAGASSSSYFQVNVLRNLEVLQASGGYQVMVANDKDYLATRVSYKLNLKGPSVTVQTACSTSLVAVQMACAAILSGQCEMALSGGVAIAFPQKTGYLYAEGMIFSPDGRCRPFDAEGRGIRGGVGAGVVVLKRLDKALEDGDTIRAVIRGAATNNDGGVKMGYTTPSVEGQARAIAEALRLAEVSPETVSYIEAHGTATPVGDPIEIAALTRVFRATTEKKQFCAVGSVKGNIGHLDAAAGAAGLIKTVLALENKRIPPSVNFSTPNPAIDFANSPFFVNTELREWQGASGPRRAGVSSFGIGGTNAHAVLEEAPMRRETKTRWPAQLLVLSAKSAIALDGATERMAEYLQANPATPLADIAYTLQVGRRRFAHRRMLVCTDRESAAAAFAGTGAQRLVSALDEALSRPVVFLFSGQGSQHAGMARALYACEPVFRSTLDRCAELLRPELGCDLRAIIYAEDGQAALLGETRYAQPSLFAVEYALARMWMSWGVQPESMIGHSIGEYVAACLAGVFSLEQALRLVAARGRLMQEMAPGGMLAVPLAEEEALRQISGHLEIAVAAVNGPRMCALAGPFEALGAVQASLEARGVQCRPLHTSHAFHSSMMDEAAAGYADVLRECSFSPPRIPFLSNVTGRWIRPEEAMDAAYWMRHLRQTVRFADGVRELGTDGTRVFLEVGPGQTLTALVRGCLPETKPGQILATLPHAQDASSDAVHLLGTVGKLWLSGVAIDWDAFHQSEQVGRVPLPTYPFEQKRYWVEPKTRSLIPELDPPGRRTEFERWFYLPSWRRSILQATDHQRHGPWLVFVNETPLCAGLLAELKRRGERVTTVRRGGSFARGSAGDLTIDATRVEDYRTLLQQMMNEGSAAKSILYLWSLEDDGHATFHRLWMLARALGEHVRGSVVQCVVVSSGLYAVQGNETVDPERALQLGPVKVAPWEYPRLRFRSVDLRAGDGTASTIEKLLGEPGRPHASRAVAYRNGYRWEQSFERGTLPATTGSAVREGGVYLITGGTGGIGLTLAGHLARAKARLALIGRTPMPERSAWVEWLTAHADEDETSAKIREFQRLEELGGEVLPLTADVCDRASMAEAVRTIRERFGTIHGVIHAAGVVKPGLLQLKTLAEAEQVLAPKVQGTLILDALLQDQPLDFFVLCSSINAIGGGAGSIDYTAANCFLDAFAASRSSEGAARVVSINWDAWRDVGMAFRRQPGAGLPQRQQREYDPMAIAPKEGVEAFERVLACGASQVAVIPRDLERLLEDAEQIAEDETPGRGEQAGAPQAEQRALYPRPDSSTPYAAPKTEIQSLMAEIWSDALGTAGIGIDDNFFELGGHSLLAIAVLGRTRDALGVTLGLRTIFDAPTIRLLSEQVETLLWATSKPVESSNDAGQREEIAF